MEQCYSNQHQNLSVAFTETEDITYHKEITNFYGYSFYTLALSVTKNMSFLKAKY